MEDAFLEAGSTAIPVYGNNTNVDTAILTNGVTVGVVTTWAVDVYVKDANDCTDFTTVTITKDVCARTDTHHDFGFATGIGN